MNRPRPSRKSSKSGTQAKPRKRRGSLKTAPQATEQGLKARRCVHDQLEAVNARLKAEIMERHRAQEAVQEREDELAAIYDHAPLIMIVVDGERQVRKINRFGESFVRASAADLLGRRAGDALGCLHALDVPEGCGFGPHCEQCTVRRMIQDTYETGASHQQLEAGQKVVVDGRSQEVTFLLSTARLEVRGRREVLVTLQDITARKRAEQALREAQARLAAYAEELEKTVTRRTAKLHETIGELEQFSYAITHDMRAPLRAMQGFADLIEEECAGCPRTTAQQYFRRIRTASRRLDQLIQDSLNYSQAVRDEVLTAPVDLEELVAGLLESYPNLQPDKADIRIEGGLPTVLGSEAALTQCFSNLLGNAVKFVAPGVRPRVRVWAETEERPNCALQSTQPEGLSGATTEPVSNPKTSIPHAASGGRLVRIWIDDNGIGVPKGQHQRIFGMFHRATKDYEGTGVGLAIVQKVVQRMGGRVGVESDEGKGSRFWLLLRAAN